MTDPLLDFYRHKEMYIKLPTEGKWYTSNIKMSDQNEIGVMPLSFKDEMLLSIPDSVYNGESLFEILKSIVPDMENPYEIMLPDVDVILLASRINNNEEGTLRTEAKCPHCESTEEYEIKIINILNQIKPVNSIEIELSNGLTIIFKPNSLKSITSNQIRITENAQLLQQLENETDQLKQHEIFQQSLERSTAASMMILADSIEKIITPSTEVIDNITSILAWLSNSDSITIKKLQEINQQINANGIDKEFKFECSNEECGKKFKSAVEFNPTFFFTNDS